METGQEILDRALQLLGYADGCGADEDSPRWQALLDRGLAAERAGDGSCPIG